LINFMNNFIIIFFFFLSSKRQWDAKCKLSPNILNRTNTNRPIKSFNDVFWDDQTQANSLSVHLLGVL
jgi:hypothetical protein